MNSFSKEESVKLMVLTCDVRDKLIDILLRVPCILIIRTINADGSIDTGGLKELFRES